MTVDLSLVEKIPGWLYPNDMDLTERVFRFQGERGVRGDILELGVYKGKYLALLYGLSATSDRVVGVDGLYEKHGVLLSEQWRLPAIQAIHTAVRSVAGEDSRLEVVPRNTMEMTSQELRAVTKAGFRFISVDAGHEAENVLNDLQLVAPLLVHGGVVAVDDAFNPIVPGVIEGFCRFMISGGLDQLAPVALGANKLFLSARESYDLWFSFFKELPFTPEEPAYLVRARARLEANAAIGYAPHMFGYEVVPLT